MTKWVFFLVLLISSQAFAIERTPFWAEEQLSHAEIAKRIEALDHWGNDDMPVAEEGDHVTPFGTVIKASCPKNVHLELEKAIALAFVRAQDCKRALRLPDMRKFISILRRNQIDCSDLWIDAAAWAHLYKEWLNRRKNREFGMTINHSFLNKWLDDLKFYQSLKLSEFVDTHHSRERLASVIFHETVHFLPQNQNGWSHGFGYWGDDDRVFVLDLACFPRGVPRIKLHEFEQSCKNSFADDVRWMWAFALPKKTHAREYPDGQVKVICDRATRLYQYTENFYFSSLERIRSKVLPFDLSLIHQEYQNLIETIVTLRLTYSPVVREFDWKKIQLNINQALAQIGKTYMTAYRGCKKGIRANENSLGNSWDGYCLYGYEAHLEDLKNISRVLSDPLWVLALTHFPKH